MKVNYLILGLITLTAIVGMYMMGNPDQADRLAQVSREAGFQGETREIALTALAFGLGAFIVYLALTRR